jgi:hypothetical protein
MFNRQTEAGNFQIITFEGANKVCMELRKPANTLHLNLFLTMSCCSKRCCCCCCCCCCCWRCLSSWLFLTTTSCSLAPSTRPVFTTFLPHDGNSSVSEMLCLRETIAVGNVQNGKYAYFSITSVLKLGEL